MGQQLTSGISDDAPVTRLEFLLMFLLLALSGNPFFSQNLPLFISVLSLISLYYLLTHYNRTIYTRTLFIFVFFIGYEFMHAFMFDLDYKQTIIKLFLILLFSFTVVNILKSRFIPVFLYTMYVICIISFVFTVLCYIPGVGRGLYNLAAALFPLQKDFKNYSTPTLIVYTFLPEFFTGAFKYTRNAGIFWESGAFAVYLNIALYLKYYTKNIQTFSDLFDRQSTVFIIAMCSAASTMGILAMVLVITFYCFRLKSNVKYIGLFLIVTVSALAFTSFDFLGSKIEKQLSVSGESNNRFGSALMDLKDIEERPILGWSRRIEVLFGTTVSSSRTHRPNGLTNFIRNYGLLYFLVYFFLVYQSFKAIGKYYHGGSTGLALLGILLLWVVSFSEQIYDEAFLKGLLFLALVYLPVARQQVQNVKVKRKFSLN
ncbi:hypothetical protein FO440_14715 [Mucilaginibacter corticis]|uniref:O-antigen ligase family protein n=1 Tax=Mucilaginibacter corticis TaxID=2597670 RepID=A0A556MM57_9SPHI|nr:hypothetical protein [Mucilaginibacter corticis]TSJ40983.1 hypothetical protein FO440_14715 [Mucilaginibacter corticis]